MKILQSINKVLESLIGVGIGIIMILVSLQVFFRYVLEMPLIGPDELTRITVIWVVLLGFAVLVRKNKHISVTFFRELFSENIQKFIRIVVHLIIASFCIIMIYHGLDLSIKAMIQRLPATGFRMGFINLAVPIAGLFSLLFSIENIINEVRNKQLEVEN